MLSEELLPSLRFLFADFEVVRRIQIDQREGFNGALHVKAVPVDHVDLFSASLFGAADVQFYPVPQNLFVRSDFSERSPIPDPRLKRATGLFREFPKSPDPLRLCNRKGVKAQTRTSRN